MKIRKALLQGDKKSVDVQDNKREGVENPYLLKALGALGRIQSITVANMIFINTHYIHYVKECLHSRNYELVNRLKF